MHIKSMFPDVPPIPDTNVHNFLFRRPDQAKWQNYTLHVDPVTGRKQKYYEFLDQVRDGATALGAPVADGGLGLRAEDSEIVAIMSENTMDYINLVHSCVAITVPFALLSFYSTPFELLHGLRLSKATRIFVQAKFFDHLHSVAQEIGFPEHNIYTISGTIPGWQSMDDLINNIRIRQTLRAETRPAKKDTLAYLIFSSGTTGLPKAVMISHGNIIFSLYQSIVHSLESNIVAPPEPPNTPEGIPVTLAFLPLHHTFGLQVYCFRAFLAPVTLVIISKWDVSTALKAIGKYRVTALSLIPSVAHQLVNHADIDKADFSSIQLLTSGAAYLPPSLANKLEGFLPKQSFFMEGYGMSECTISALGTPRPGLLGGRGKYVPGSTGLLIPGMEARIVRDDGTEADVNEDGELLLRGGNVALGYWNNPKATRETFVDGWLHTGDRFRVDADGYFFFCDRAKDTLKVSGMQVSPTEIENVLLAHPDGLISDAAVAGVSGGRTLDEKVPRAWVVLGEAGRRRGHAAAMQALEAWTRKNLSKYKWLRGGIEVVGSIPKTPTGKVLRRQLQERYESTVDKPVAKL